VTLIVQAARRAAGVDIEALEVAVRDAVLKAGATVLEDLLRNVGVGRRATALRCTCGALMDSRGVKTKSIQTLLGWIGFSRSAYRCPVCAKIRHPGDEELDVVKTRYSPGVRRLVSDFASDVPFKRVSRQVRSGAGLAISRKDCERIAEAVGQDMARWAADERNRMRFADPPPPHAPKSIETLYIEFDGTGVPMVPHEVAGRKGKQEDGSAKTREAKLGCVFTQTDFDDEDRPVRDLASTTFTGSIEPAAEFGWRIYGEAVRRGLFEAKRVVCLGDGAQWVKNLAQTHFSQAQFIIDFYHAKEHVMDLGRALFDRDLKRLDHYKERWWDLLAQGNIEQLIQEAQHHLPKDPRAGKDARTQVGYFRKNKEYMRYAHYTSQGMFIGSGVIEAACKSVIGQRLKQSGMEWTVRGANAITTLRCVVQSNRFEDYWEARAA